jgi:beta-N-acetylhexosaminidase
MSGAALPTKTGSVPRAVVLGCAGERLTADERRFFAEADPIGFVLFRRNCKDPDQVRALVVEMRDAVGRADAPVLIDQEGGRVQRLQPPHWRRYPAPARIGALADAEAEEAARLAARLIADDLAALGVDVDALPVLDLPVAGADPVIGDRAYGGGPERVARLGRAACGGLLQGGVLPIVKHIPGHGRAQVDSHRDLPRVDASRETLGASDFTPFRALADMPWAMTAHIVYTAIDPDAPATFSHAVIEEIIRQHIGFDGVLISDDLSMGALQGSLAERTRRSLAAGCDVALHCNGVLAEMQEVAEAASPLTAAAQARLARAEALRRNSAQSFDRAAAEARFAELLGESIVAGSRASPRA